MQLKECENSVEFRTPKNCNPSRKLFCQTKRFLLSTAAAFFTGRYLLCGPGCIERGSERQMTLH